MLMKTRKYYCMQKAPGQYRQTTQRIFLLLILTRFMCSEKENTVFTDPKDCQVKHYSPNKKAVTLSIGCTFLFPSYLGRSKGLCSQGTLDLAKKNFWGFKVISNLSFKYMPFLYLWEVIFVADVGVLTSETFLTERKVVFKPVFFKEFQTSENHWISLWGLWNTRKRYVCEKGNIEGRERGCRQNLYRGSEKTSDKAGEKPTRFLTSQWHKTFSALNYAQDFQEPQ